MPRRRCLRWRVLRQSQGHSGGSTKAIADQSSRLTKHEAYCADGYAFDESFAYRRSGELDAVADVELSGKMLVRWVSIVLGAKEEHVCDCL